ncbi:MAG: M48 family metallopeptidase [Anaerolineae bacterium]|nr:M48 family metallopeptidase [Anaerolineae bacterium]MEB2287350.1 M48 family metallopeptidase [Anaerolineae bacterium]
MTRTPHSTRPEIVRQVADGPHTLTVEVVRDRRLRSSARWTLHGETIQVRAPAALPRKQLDELLDKVIARILKQRKRARSLDDADLERRARRINRAYFAGELNWHSIRWVSTMQRRLGSCTSGGSTDGDIRISERIREWPGYVVDYVIAHELAHRRHPNHSADFWAYLARYPHTERARGFIEGFAYAQRADPDDLL